jgi:hypothetical protein
MMLENQIRCPECDAPLDVIGTPEFAVIVLTCRQNPRHTYRAAYAFKASERSK